MALRLMSPPGVPALHSGKSARGNQNAGRTDATLQSVEFEKVALKRVKIFALRHALDGFDLVPVDLDAEHEAGAHHDAVDHDGAGAAVASGAAFLGAREHQL